MLSWRVPCYAVHDCGFGKARPRNAAINGAKIDSDPVVKKPRSVLPSVSDKLFWSSSHVFTPATVIQALRGKPGSAATVFNIAAWISLEDWLNARNAGKESTTKINV